MGLSHSHFTAFCARLHIIQISHRKLCKGWTNCRINEESRKTNEPLITVVYTINSRSNIYTWQKIGSHIHTYIHRKRFQKGTDVNAPRLRDIYEKESLRWTLRRSVNYRAIDPRLRSLKTTVYSYIIYRFILHSSIRRRFVIVVIDAWYLKGNSL